MRVASTAIGLSMWMGKGRIRPSLTIWSIRMIICWARPTAKAGISSTPPRANVRCSPIATLHRPTARWSSSSNARVMMPTGLVKATIQASGAAGTTVRGIPSGMSSPQRAWKASSVAAAGQWPTPATVCTCPVSAS